MLVTGVRQNVGGSIPETGMNLVVHGSRAGDSLVMVDGMPIINGSGTGGLQYGNYLNNAMAQEITFQTDSHSRRVRAGVGLLELHPERRVEHLPRVVHGPVHQRVAWNRTTWMRSRSPPG